MKREGRRDATGVPPSGGMSHPPARVPRPAPDLSRLQRAIILTVLYSDLFDYALTDSELRRYLIVPCPEPSELEGALSPLIGTCLTRTERYLTMAGREPIVEVRRQRERSSARGWRWPNGMADGWAERRSCVWSRSAARSPPVTRIETPTSISSS